jgi:hypothetical protein
MSRALLFEIFITRESCRHSFSNPANARPQSQPGIPRPTVLGSVMSAPTRIYELSLGLLCGCIHFGGCLDSCEMNKRKMAARWFLTVLARFGGAARARQRYRANRNAFWNLRYSHTALCHIANGYCIPFGPLAYAHDDRYLGWRDDYA